MDIRDAVRDDLQAVIDLHITSWRATYRGLMPADYLDGPVSADHRDMWLERARQGLSTAAPEAPKLFVATDDAFGLVGFAYVIPGANDDNLLENLHVAPERQRRGLGHRLFRHVLAWSLQAHPDRAVWLEVYRGNEPAIAFYERQGGLASPGRTEVFDGFEMHDIVYTWPARTVRTIVAEHTNTEA